METLWMERFYAKNKNKAIAKCANDLVNVLYEQLTEDALENESIAEAIENLENALKQEG